jgi:hypothetical protein
MAICEACNEDKLMTQYTSESLKKWWPAVCLECDWHGLSRDAAGGEALADTGDFADVVCPDCGTPLEEDKDIEVVDVDWGQFASWLLDHHEGDVISEELLQHALCDMLHHNKTIKGKT